MDRRDFMRMCGVTLLAPVCGIAFGSKFPRTRFYLNGELYRDFPADFAHEDERGSEKALTEVFKDHREKMQQYGSRWGDEIYLGRSSHAGVGDALFIKKSEQRDFYCDDPDLTLVHGKIVFIGNESSWGDLPTK